MTNQVELIQIHTFPWNHGIISQGRLYRLAGSIPGRTQTLPLAIYDHVQANQMREANALALLTVAGVLILLLGLGRVGRLRY